MLSDLEFVLRRINAVVTGSKSDTEKVSTVQQLVTEWAEEISFKLD